MRVLHVVGSIKLGGTEAFIMNLYRNIDKDKIQFDFLVLSDFDVEPIYEKEINELGGKIYFGEFPEYRCLCRFLKKTSKFIKEGGYDCVHSHLNIINTWVLMSAKFAKVKMIVSHSHDTFGKGGRFVKKALHSIETVILKKVANTYLACSKEAGHYLYGPKFFDKNGRIIKNSIDYSHFFVSADDLISNLKEEFAINSDTYIIGNISRFEAKKNQLFIIDIFAELLKKQPNMILILGGVDGGQLNECISKVRTLNLEDNVRFIGPRNDVNIILQMLDCFIFPSLYEGLGIILLEAQATGCKCIASDKCPNDSDMGLGLIRYLPLDRDEKYWAENIFEFISSKMEINNSDIERAFITKGYSTQTLVEDMSNIYLKGLDQVDIDD